MEPLIKSQGITLREQDLADIRWAYQHLEHPSFAARLSNAIGSPIESGLKLLPQRWYAALHSAVEANISKTLQVAIMSMEHVAPSPSNDVAHKIMAMGTGVVGGFFGPLALLAELPITTALMLRSIADIAHSQGEDLNTREARVACMEVFALGGRAKDDDAADTGYYGLRLTLGFHFSSALLHTGFASPSGVNIPAGVQLIRAIASRFSIVISDKAAAQVIPIAGAISGGLVNLIFMRHFQDVARGHFILRRLERAHGSDAIRAVYEQLAREEAEAKKEYSSLEGW